MDKIIKVTVPILKGTINKDLAESLYNKGYRKVRAVVVFPSMQDREAVCQGVACPTLYTDNHRGTNEEDVNKNTRDLYAQSSWFFRVPKSDSDKSDGTYTPENNNDQDFIPYVDKDGSPVGIKKVEIQGHYDNPNKFRIDRKLLTFHSPDIEFDESFGNADFSGLKFSQVGSAQISKTLASIDIQTETPSIDVDRSAGFTKMSFTGSRANGIISGLFYEDFPVDDDVNQTTGFVKYSKYTYPARWMVYPWNKNGSLNNDIDRPADKGVRSAVLRQKIISNLRYSSVTAYDGDGSTADFTVKPQLFSSNEDSIMKLDTGQTNLSNVYQGNIDTLLMPDGFSGMHFAKMGIWVGAGDYNTGAFTGESPVPFNYDYVYYKTFANVEEQDMHGVYFWQSSGWDFLDKNIGNEYLALVVKKENVRMKYKSTRHLVFGAEDLEWLDASLPVVELRRGWDDEERINKMFGGRSVDALKENVWIPCGNSVSLCEMSGDTRVFKNVEYYYEWGDTYYQRWDCLKTYAFTPDDANQIVEIGSFMLESRVNIDGRYDHNRGQMNNLYMSPINFNLLNPVYSQQNNFFSYRIQDSDFYKEKRYPNQITWSLVKTSGADVDKWTNVTLASILELDGDKGSIRKIIKLNDQLLCFQDKGISQILYNENTQISTTEGTPIEIANSGKVQGKKYVSDSIGCSNKWSIAQTPAGIYFMDSINKHIFMFNGQLNNLSGTFGFNAWSKKNIPAEEDIQWTPVFPTPNDDSRSSFVSYYDKLNQDVLFINKDTALAFSEKLGAFTSFYDYGNSPYFCNLQDTGIWLRNNKRKTTPSEQADPIDIPTINIYRHQGGESYCSFFGETKPFWMTLVGNPEPQLDKIFTNLEFRACIDGDGVID